VSLAHLGVLFLDEFPEYRLSALEGLRQPLEDGEVTISRRLTSVTYPARLMLVAAMNPCPCGFNGDKGRECVCPGFRLAQYRSRLSGPLLDRIDLRLDVERVPPRARREKRRSDASAVIRERVVRARTRQLSRLTGSGVYANAHMSSRQLRRFCPLEPAAAAKLDLAYDRMRLSARAADRVVKVARTIADLAGADVITAEHIGESLGYRDRRGEPDA
jgi:magnesium chelatase family protein